MVVIGNPEILQPPETARLCHTLVQDAQSMNT